MAKSDFYLSRDELDSIQMKVIEAKISNSILVTGCAGSGKTLIALWKAKAVQDQEKSFLFVTYTKVLTQYMRAAIKEIGLDSTYVTHYNGIYDLQHNLRSNKFFKNTNLYKKIVNKDFDYVIIDEAQDFNEIEIQNLVKLAKTAVHIYGDNAQQLYKYIKKITPLSIKEINERLKIYCSKRWGKESSDIELLYNHRLPKKIARFAKNIPEEKEKIKDLEDRCTKEGVSKPKIYHFATLEEQLKKITEIIENNNMEDVGILFFKNDDIIVAYDILKKFNFDTEYRYRDTSEDVNTLDFETQLPKLITYYSAKGLQFKNVFLPECHIDNNKDRNALYVAATRSSDSLYIMHSENLSPFIRNIDKNLYDNYEINNSEKNTYSNKITESINIENKINSDNTDDIIF